LAAHAVRDADVDDRSRRRPALWHLLCRLEAVLGPAHALVDLAVVVVE
jgi:hypothetical protein